MSSIKSARRAEILTDSEIEIADKYFQEHSRDGLEVL